MSGRKCSHPSTIISGFLATCMLRRLESSGQTAFSWQVHFRMSKSVIRLLSAGQAANMLIYLSKYRHIHSKHYIYIFKYVEYIYFYVDVVLLGFVITRLTSPVLTSLPFWVGWKWEFQSEQQEVAFLIRQVFSINFLCCSLLLITKETNSFSISNLARLVRKMLMMLGCERERKTGEEK